MLSTPNPEANVNEWAAHLPDHSAGNSLAKNSAQNLLNYTPSNPDNITLYMVQRVVEGVEVVTLGPMTQERLSNEQRPGDRVVCFRPDHAWFVV